MCLLPLLRTHPPFRIPSSFLYAPHVNSEGHRIRWVCRMELLAARQFGNVRTASYFHWKGSHTLLLSTWSLAYQPGKQWCWWHFPFKHFVLLPNSEIVSWVGFIPSYWGAEMKGELPAFQRGVQKKKKVNSSIFSSLGIFFFKIFWAYSPLYFFPLKS